MNEEYFTVSAKSVINKTIILITLLLNGKPAGNFSSTISKRKQTIPHFRSVTSGDIPTCFQILTLNL
jgi:hypothetical protein